MSLREAQTSWQRPFPNPIPDFQAFPSPTKLFLTLQDTNSGRQQWTFVNVTGGYHIAIRSGREGCGDLLTGQACDNDAVNLEAAGNGLQVWSVTNIAAG